MMIKGCLFIYDEAYLNDEYIRAILS